MTLPFHKRCTQRITITIPYNVHQRVLTLSDNQGRSASNFIAYMLERGLETFYPNSRDSS